MLLLFIATQPAPAQPGYANLSLALSDVWPALNASGPADAPAWVAGDPPDASHVLFQYMNDAAIRLARKTGAFVVRDETLVSVAGTASYDFPSYHLFTLQMDLAGRTLRPRTVRELEARDSDWPDTNSTVDDPPSAFVQDTQGFDKITLYGIPFADGDTIGLVMGRMSPEVSATAAVIAIPPVIRDYFTYSAIARARAKESVSSMDEIVPFLESVLEMIEETATGLWGFE